MGRQAKFRCHAPRSPGAGAGWRSHSQEAGVPLARGGRSPRRRWSRRRVGWLASAWPRKDSPERDRWGPLGCRRWRSRGYRAQPALAWIRPQCAFRETRRAGSGSPCERRRRGLKCAVGPGTASGYLPANDGPPSRSLPSKSLISRTSGTRTRKKDRQTTAYPVGPMCFVRSSIAFATVLSLTPSARAIALSLILRSRSCIAFSVICTYTGTSVRESLPSWRKLEMVCEVEGFAVTTARAIGGVAVPWPRCSECTMSC